MVDWSNLKHHQDSSRTKSNFHGCSTDGICYRHVLDAVEPLRSAIGVLEVLPRRHKGRSCTLHVYAAPQTPHLSVRSPFCELVWFRPRRTLPEQQICGASHSDALTTAESTNTIRLALHHRAPDPVREVAGMKDVVGASKVAVMKMVCVCRSSKRVRFGGFFFAANDFCMLYLWVVYIFINFIWLYLL